MNIEKDAYQNKQEQRLSELNGDAVDELTDTELQMANAIQELEIATLRHQNAQLRQQAELHEATRDRLRAQRDAALERVRRIRDVLDAGY